MVSTCHAVMESDLPANTEFLNELMSLDDADDIDETL